MEVAAEGEVVHGGEVDNVGLDRGDVLRDLATQSEPSETALVAQGRHPLRALHVPPERGDPLQGDAGLAAAVEEASGDNVTQL